MSSRLNIDAIKEQVKGYLPQYLAKLGVQPGPMRKFKCINPDHNDSNPSCSYIPGTDDRLFHCFSCNITGDIFLAANFLEDKPLSGRGFISDNLLYLAKECGIEVPELSLTDDELYEMEVYRAYSNAASIIKTPTKLSDKVTERITTLGWPAQVMTKIGVGSVASYDDYMSRMARYGHTPQFLEDVDLARRYLFNHNNLLFTIKDEDGAPVGFAARNLLYERQKTQYDADLKHLLETEPEGSAKFDELFKPAKYINTDAKCKIYQKSKRLFNYNLAKKFSPLYVFEGQGDCVTLYAAGLKGSTAIGSTAFTREHLELILNSEPPIKHLIFVLDADKAGDAGTAKFVKLIEEQIGGHVGLRVEIITMPEGSDDPDSYVRKFGFEKGLEEFRKLEKIDIFTWKMRESIKQGGDPLTIAQGAVPLIVNEPNFLIRMDMTEKLSKATGLDKEGLWREVMRQVDSESMRIEEEKALIAKRTAQALTRDCKDVQAILQSALDQTEMVEKRRAGYDPRNTVSSVEFVLERASKVAKRMELETGFPLLDKAINGIPVEEAFISVPGKPNQGKSTFLDNLTIGLLNNNKDVTLLFHSIDDSLSIRIARLLAAKFHEHPKFESPLHSEYFKRSGYYLANPPFNCPNFEEIYNAAKIWLAKQVEEERLVLADVAGLPPSLPALESWVKSIRSKFPKRSVVVMGDNFHLYDLSGFDPGESKVRAMSQFVKRMTTEHRVTCLMTCELPKESLRPGTRPRISKIKGTSGVAYDASANFGIYNDLKDRPEDADLIWYDDSVQVQGTNGHISHVMNNKMPIIEVIVDKSKLSSFDGTIYYRLHPDSGKMTECEQGEQDTYQNRANDYNKGHSFNGNSFPNKSN